MTCDPTVDCKYGLIKIHLIAEFSFTNETRCAGHCSTVIIDILHNIMTTKLSHCQAYLVAECVFDDSCLHLMSVLSNMFDFFLDYTTSEKYNPHL